MHEQSDKKLGDLLFNPKGTITLFAPFQIVHLSKLPTIIKKFQLKVFASMLKV